MLIDHVEVVEDVGLVGCPIRTCPTECSDVLTRTVRASARGLSEAA
jgi:hypothetical protein